MRSPASNVISGPAERHRPGGWATHLFLGLILAGMAMNSPILLAQGTEPASDEEESKPLLSVERIEINVYGGVMGGDTYLDLPLPFDPERTRDTAANNILDFSGNPSGILAPHKEIENGVLAGGSAIFYLSPNFGMTVYGQYGRADAVLTGLDDFTSTQRREVDRTTMRVIAAGGGIIYHLGKERKHPIRPYITMSFGGVLNQFDDTDDVGALYFQYGGGVTLPVTGHFRAQIGLTTSLFSWNTDEVDLDTTVNFPSVVAGLIWRHDVPPPSGTEWAEKNRSSYGR